MKNENHNMDDLFKRAFDEHSVPPPNALWSKIERELPSPNSDQIFQKAFSDYEVEPPPQAWGKIKRRLPINLILRRHLTWLSGVAAVLLVGMFVMYALDNWDWSTDNSNAVAQTTTNPTHSATTTTTDASHTPVVSDVVNAQKEAEAANSSTTGTTTTNRSDWPVIEFNHPAIETSNTRTSTKSTPATKPVATTDAVPSMVLPKRNGTTAVNGERPLIFDQKETVTKPVANSNKVEKVNILATDKPIAAIDTDEPSLEIRNLYINTLETPNLNPLATALSGQGSAKRLTDLAKNSIGIQEGSQSEMEEAMNFKGFYVSANAQAFSSNIGSRAIRQQVATMENIEVSKLLDFGHSFGANIGYKLTDKLSLETGLDYSKQGQIYREVSVNTTYTTEIDVNYYRVPVVLKYRQSEISGNKPSSLSLVAGTQFSFLSGDPMMNTTDSENNNNVPNVDKTLLVQNGFGLVVGVDRDVFLNPNLSLTYGLRASAETNFSNPFQTYNVLVGARAAFNFRFARR